MALITCPECGKEVSDKAASCPSCGAPLNNLKFCKHCGEKIDKECIICPRCGKQVEQLESFSGKNIVINNNNNNNSSSSSSASASASAVAMATQVAYMRGKPINKWVSLVLCIFLGMFGAHKFYEGKSGMGILYIFTVGLFGIGWIIDIISIALKPNPYYV